MPKTSAQQIFNSMCFSSDHLSSKCFTSKPVSARPVNVMCMRQRKHHRKVAAGFTLFEILIVMVVIAILTGMIALTTSDSPARVLKEEAERFDAFVRLLQDESVLMGTEYGLFIYSDGLRVMEWYEPEEEALQSAQDAAADPDNNDDVVATIEEGEQQPLGGYWQPIQNSQQFKFEHQFPETIEVLAWVEGAELELFELTEDEKLMDGLKELQSAEKLTPELISVQQEAAQLQPALLFLSSGEATAYRVRLSWDGDLDQRFEVVSDVIGNVTFVRPGESYDEG